MNTVRFLILTCFSVWLLGSCKQESKVAKQITIISTNDIHAQISRFPQLSELVKQKRANGEVILVDAGDRFSGNPYVDNAPEKGEPVIRLMNKIGYDLAAMGNHDFDYGQQTLKKRIEEANFKILCGNIESGQSEVGSFPEYAIIEKGGVTFCFFSLIETGNDYIPATNPGNLKNISFHYYKDKAQDYKRLTEKSDVLIGLTHLGVYNDSLLAMVMPELDVIIGGHSHTQIHDTRKINGVMIGQSGSNLYYAGVTTLTFEGKKLIDKKYELVKLKEIGTPDQEIALMVEEINNRPEFKKVVAQATEDLTTKESVASVMTDAMCDQSGSDMAFYNRGGVRMNTIPCGDITMETIFKIEPFANYIVTQQWTLDQLKQFILKEFNSVKNKDERYINLYISAGSYEIIRDKNKDGIDIKFYDKDKKQLTDMAKSYKIAFSNYIASSNVELKDAENTGIYITEAMLAYLEKKGEIDNSGERAFIK